jgi:hypothetical protein
MTGRSPGATTTAASPAGRTTGPTGGTTTGVPQEEPLATQIEGGGGVGQISFV